MTIARKNRVIVAVMAIPLALSLLAGAGRALGAPQEGAEKPAAVQKQRAKPRGRLPNYYSSVVTQEQRLKIYDIQAKYAEQIQQLQEQLQTLAQKQAADVEGVLTPEQKDKVQQMQADAQARRVKAQAAKGATASPPAEDSGQK